LIAKNRKGIAPALVLLGVLVLGLLVFGGFTFFSVVSAPAQLQLSNGKYFWVSTFSVDSVESINLISANKQVQDGKTIDPTAGSFKIGWSPKEAYCDSSLTRVRTISSSGGVYNYYYSGAPAKQLKFGVYAEKKGVRSDKMLSSNDLLSPITFQDPDGKGVVTVTNLGFLGGKYDCGSFSDVALIRTNSSVSGRIVSKSALQAALSSYDSALAACGYTNAVCRLNVLVAFVKQMISLPRPSGIDLSSIYFDFDKLYFRNNIPLVLSGSSLISVTADADYFDTIIYSPQEVSKPVLSLSKIAFDLYSGKETQLVARVTNTGSASQRITITAQAEKGSILGETAVVVAGGQSQDVPLTIRALYTTIATFYGGSVKACSSNQFGVALCDEKTFIVSVQPEPVLPTPTIRPTVTPSVPAGAVVCLPFVQKSGTQVVGGFQLLFWNIGGTTVSTCEWDYVGMTLILALILLFFLLKSGKITSKQLFSPSVLIIAGGALFGWVLANAIPFIGSALAPIFAVAGGILGLLLLMRGGFR